MTTWKGVGQALANYTVVADDKEQAMDYIFEMVKEDFPDAEAYEVFNIELIEVD